MSWIKKLLGSQTSEKSKANVEPVEYKEFQIQPQPMEENGQYRISAMISRGEQEHHFIRSDVIPSEDECIKLTVLKAKRLIDEQGESIF